MAKNLIPFTLPIPGWNERRMTSEDFDAICAREQIMEERHSGLETG